MTPFDLRRAQAKLEHATERYEQAERRQRRLMAKAGAITDDEIYQSACDVNDAALELAVAQITLEELEGTK